KAKRAGLCGAKVPRKQGAWVERKSEHEHIDADYSREAIDARAKINSDRRQGKCNDRGVGEREPGNYCNENGGQAEFHRRRSLTDAALT
ncbi:MAG: hypothetical protein WCI67_17200, partial [Chloroflexales bacterium]